MRTQLRVDSLRRFTSLSSAIDLLRKERIAFLDPSTWDDRNDASYMDLYKEFLQLSSLHALCCSEASETFHHWKVFTQSPDGCFIDFYKDRLLSIIADDKNYVSRPMRYLLLREMKTAKADLGVGDLPFIKRRSFADEREFRIIHIGDAPSGQVHYLEIDLSCVRRIVINPIMPSGVRASVKATLRDLCGEHRIRITASAITSSSEWKSYGRAIAHRARQVGANLPAAVRE